MNILLVYPKYPDTFWSFRHALKFVSKKASFPPLGLLTISSMLPKDWNKKLIDLNADSLLDKDILWADYVFISAMSIQSDSVAAIIKRCKSLNTKIVAGGPHFTSSFKLYDDVDYLVLNEAEITLPLFLNDLKNGELKKIYTSDEWADISTTPLPDWNIVKLKNYTSMNIQYSRGCPYDCDFCDITVLYGHKPRTKSKEQIINELEAVYNSGWRGPLFFVDDNFIGNKTKLKKEILPAISDWMEKRQSPFYLNTEASINMADDDELMKLMVKAGFEAVFIGIETPNYESLIECNKNQNKNRDLIESIKKIQNAGLQVQGGFIVGFDNDPENIFDKISNFIQSSGVVIAMVGLLNAPKGTKLEKRLIKEGRMLNDFSGNNANIINFIPKMNYEKLMEGYKNVVQYIYKPNNYYKRVKTFLREYKPTDKNVFHINHSYIMALFKSIFILGIFRKERIYYWRLFFWTLFMKPRLFSLAITFVIYGFHFRKVSNSF